MVLPTLPARPRPLRVPGRRDRDRDPARQRAAHARGRPGGQPLRAAPGAARRVRADGARPGSASRASRRSRRCSWSRSSGTLNPTAGDVSVFLPTEQALLAEARDVRARTAASRATTSRARCSARSARWRPGCPSSAATRFGGRARRTRCAPCSSATRLSRWRSSALYLGLGPTAGAPRAATRARRSRARAAIVLRLTALFALDSFGGGFAVQSLLALWLFQRFELSLAEAGTFFFAASIAVGLLAVPLAAARGAHRADRDDGLHPPAGERAPDRGRLHADGAARARLSARARRRSRRWTCPRASPT